MNTRSFQTKQRIVLRLSAIVGLLIAPMSGFSAPQDASVPTQLEVSVPAGTMITVRLIDSVSLAGNIIDGEFGATIDVPVIEDDRVVIRRGTPASVRLVRETSGNHRRPGLGLELVSIGANASRVAVDTAPKQVCDFVPRSSARSSLGKGAIVGAILGGLTAGRIGVVVGAGAGALVGEGIHAARHNHALIPAETQMDFMLITPAKLSNSPISERSE